MELDGLRAALDRLVARGVLDQAQAGAVLTEVTGPAAPAPRGVRRLLGEIAGYLGASFVVGATVLFLGEQWEELGRGGRFGVLAAMAVVLFGVGVVVRLRREVADDVRRRLASTLMTGGAGAAGSAAFVILDRDYPYEDRAWLVAAAVGLVVVAGGYLLARSALGQLGAAAAAYSLYLAALDAVDATRPVPVGLGAVLIGVIWTVMVWRRVVAERRLGAAVAITFGLLGGQLLLIDWDGPAANYPGYGLTAVVAAACFSAYVRYREWVMLAGGVAGATLVVPEFLWDVTDGSLGAAGVMLVAGVTLLAGSLAGLRIRRAPAGHPA